MRHNRAVLTPIAVSMEAVHWETYSAYPTALTAR